MNRVKRSLAAVRFFEWWNSKLAVAATVALSLAVVSDTGPATAAKTILLGLIPIAALAAFGYGINDVADAEADRRAGKGRRPPLAGMSAKHALLALAPLVLVGVGSALALSLEAGVIEATGFILAASYSLEPLRMKERGLGGVLVAASAQRVVPTGLFLALFEAERSALWALLAGGLFVWSALVGLRFGATHQILDAANDRRAGLRTWGALRGERSLDRIVHRIILPAEAAAFALIAAVLVVSSPWAALGLAPAIPGWFLLANRRRRLGLRFDTLPLVDVYGTWWPVAVLGALVVRDVHFAAVAVGYFLLFRSPWIWKQATWMTALLHGLMRKRPESSSPGRASI
jgi:4-hydroxybenzoate polyprenyltransferase